MFSKPVSCCFFVLFCSWINISHRVWLKIFWKTKTQQTFFKKMKRNNPVSSWLKRNAHQICCWNTFLCQYKLKVYALNYINKIGIIYTMMVCPALHSSVLFTLTMQAWLENILIVSIRYKIESNHLNFALCP